MTSEEIIDRLRQAKNRMEVSRATGIPYGSLCKIASGETKDPRTSTIERLGSYFSGIDDPAAVAQSDRRAAA
jgi:hypothetical protein